MTDAPSCVCKPLRAHACVGCMCVCLFLYVCASACTCVSVSENTSVSVCMTLCMRVHLLVLWGGWTYPLPQSLKKEIDQKCSVQQLLIWSKKHPSPLAPLSPTPPNLPPTYAPPYTKCNGLGLTHNFGQHHKRQTTRGQNKKLEDR